MVHYKSLKVLIQLVKFNKVSSMVPVQQMNVQDEATSKGRETQCEESWLALVESGKVKSNRKDFIQVIFCVTFKVMWPASNFFQIFRKTFTAAKAFICEQNKSKSY